LLVAKGKFSLGTGPRFGKKKKKRPTAEAVITEDGALKLIPTALHGGKKK